MEVYQEGFRAEREGREELASEQEALRKELRVMEERNLLLLEFSHGPEDGYT